MPTGEVETWGTGADAKGFAGRTDKLIAYFDGYTTADGQKINGRHTLVENIALLAERELAAFETNDVARHWRTRRSGYWGYMHDLQARIAIESAQLNNELIKLQSLNQVAQQQRETRQQQMHQRAFQTSFKYKSAN